MVFVFRARKNRKVEVVFAFSPDGLSQEGERIGERFDCQIKIDAQVGTHVYGKIIR